MLTSGRGRPCEDRLSRTAGSVLGRTGLAEATTRHSAKQSADNGHYVKLRRGAAPSSLNVVPRQPSSTTALPGRPGIPVLRPSRWL